MKLAAITSMDKKYFNHCGKAMLNSYKKNMSTILPLYVYNEDNFKIKISPVKCQGWDLGEEFENFQQRHSANAKICQFAKKGFSIIKAMEEIECDRLTWLDGDLIFTNKMPRQLFELMSPDDVLSTHLSVWHWKNNIKYHSCETGFFILNKNHPGFSKFKEIYTEIYTKDKDTDLRRFYDGEVYGKTVEIMENEGYKMINLNTGSHRTPIPRSILAPYMIHYKAGLKDNISNDLLEEKHELKNQDDQ